MSEKPDETCIFRTSTRLAAAPATLFAFHSDPRNLVVVMPPTLRLVSLKTDGPAKKGRLIELHCRDWFVIPMHWTCRWRTVQPPTLLVDEIVAGPFRIFVHEHRFEPDGAGGCVMTDQVTYAFGRGASGAVAFADRGAGLSPCPVCLPPPAHPCLGRTSRRHRCGPWKPRVRESAPSQ